MNDTEEREGEEVLAKRLIERLENPDPSPTDERGLVAADHIAHLDKVHSSTEIDESHLGPEHPANTAVFAKVEKSLMSLGFFTPSSRRIKNEKQKTINFVRTVDGKRVEATVAFHPSASFGLPITADQDKYLALHNIITNLLKENGSITNPIRFTSAELLRLLDKQRHSGKNYKAIVEWLDVMMGTMIISEGVVYEAGQKKFARDRFHVFQRAVSVGKELPDGSTADANYVWLSEWQLENINAKFLMPIDLIAYRQLKTHIAKALVPLLQVWLFASQKAGLFEKRYDELCEMLSLKTHRAPSLIKQQLRAPLNELTHHGYLKNWEIERTADKRSFKVIFFHGPKFHRDRQRRLIEKMQAEERTVVAKYEPHLPEPGKLEQDDSTTVLSAEHGTVPNQQGSAVVVETPTENQLHDVGIQRLIDELSARDILPATAKKLLEALPREQLERVGDYIDYWDVTRRSQEVGAGLLYRLIKDGQPLPSSVETRGQRLQRQEQEREIDGLRRKIAAEKRFSVSDDGDHVRLRPVDDGNNGEPTSRPSSSSQ